MGLFVPKTLVPGNEAPATSKPAVDDSTRPDSVLQHTFAEPRSVRASEDVANFVDLYYRRPPSALSVADQQPRSPALWL